jgi:hypothetical protein
MTYRRRKFYVVAPESGTGFRPLCQEMRRAPRWGGGFGDCPEPIFVADRKLGPVHRDFQLFYEYWFVSERMRSFLQAVDPEAFVYLRCHIQSPDAQELPSRWLCDVVRTLDALIEQKSEVKIGVAGDGSKIYREPGAPRKLFFKESVVGNCHVFRMEYCIFVVICDEEFKQAFRAAGMTGISFGATR